MSYKKYYDLKDEEIISEIRKGNKIAQDFIFDKYKPLVKSIARKYFLIGGDREDLIQEGMIGLYKAIQDFDESKKVLFSSFAELCITRQILSLIRTASRKKHMPLNNYTSFFYERDSDDKYSSDFNDYLKDNSIVNPEEVIINSESYKSFEKELFKVLSPLEKEILNLYLLALTYDEISKKISKDKKSIDNAIQRIRNKISK